jgi:hypothetical protein
MVELKTIITDYVSQKNTDFAILINGQWGSGKTYFWKNVIIPEIKKVEHSKDKSKSVFYEPVYVSLFGVSSAVLMLQKLFLQLIPVKILQGKMAELAMRGAMTWLKKLTGNNVSDEQMMVEIASQFKGNKVICFDDLERASSNSINDILGYINQFVEHDKLKVILLADEKELEKMGDLYPKIKEKLIRFTYEFKPNIEDILPNMLTGYKDKKYSDFILAQKPLLTTAFENGKHNNLRTLRFILDIFKSIFDQVSKISEVKQENQEAILSSLLHFTLPYSIEYKKDSKNELLNIVEGIDSKLVWEKSLIESIYDAKPNDPYSTTQSTEEKTISKEQKFKNDFIDNYVQIGEYRNFKYSQSVRDYIHTGYLNLNNFKSELIALQVEIEKQIISREQFLLHQVNNAMLLDDREFKEILDELIQKAKAGSFKLESYPAIIRGLIPVENENLFDFKMDEKFMDEIIDGMNKSLPNNVYQTFFGDYPSTILEKDARFKKIYDYSVELNNKLREKSLNEIGVILLNHIKKRDLDGIKFLLTDKAHQHAAFLQHISANEVMDSLKSAQNDFIFYFTNLLPTRYPMGIMHGQFLPEKDFIKQLGELSEKEAAAVKPTNLRGLNFSRLANTCKEIIRRSTG